MVMVEWINKLIDEYPAATVVLTPESFDSLWVREQPARHHYGARGIPYLFLRGVTILRGGISLRRCGTLFVEGENAVRYESDTETPTP